MKQILLSLLMVLPLVANADDSGICGDGVTYVFEEATHTLTISKTGEGTGEMYSFLADGMIPFDSRASVKQTRINKHIPWISYKKDIIIVVVNSGVTSICNYAFSNCSDMALVTISAGVTYIGDDAFSGCSSLASVYISDVATWCNISFNNSWANPLSNTAHLFLNGNEIKDLVIPNGVTSIGDYAFSGCSSLTSLDIPAGVTSIGDYAFSGCSGLTSVDISPRVTSIGDYVFSGCSGLTSLYIPAGVTSISDYAFSDCSGLTSVDIPAGVTSIGNSAFSGCSGLTSVDIPAEVTSIGDYAFVGCSGLTSVDIPSGVTSIGDGAFLGCSGLTSVTISKGVTTIDEGTFSGCYNLNSLFLPDGLKIIKNKAFYGCSELKTLTIPASVEYIYSQAFYYCPLEVINAQPTAPPFIYNNTFSSYTAQLNVPSGCITAYKEADYWKNFNNISDGNMNYQLALTATEGGTIVYGDQTVTATTKTFDVKEGSSFMLTITPSSGYELTTLLLNGVVAQLPVTGGELMLSGFKENTTVVATFTLEQKDEVAIKMSTADGDCMTMGYSSLYGLDFTSVKGVTAWTATSITTKGELLLSRVKIVPPNTGIILISEVAGAEVSVPTTTEGALCSNMLLPVASEETIAPTESVNGEEYMNFVVGTLSNGDPGLVRLAQSSTLGPNDVRLMVPSRFNNDLVESQGGLKLSYSIQGDMNGDKKLTPADAIMVLYRYFGADTGNGSRATRLTMTPE